MRLCDGDDEAFFVGGSSLYEQALPLADRLCITEIQADYEGDAHFPEFDSAHWRETARERHTSAAGLAYCFVTYDRGDGG